MHSWRVSGALASFALVGCWGVDGGPGLHETGIIIDEDADPVVCEPDVTTIFAGQHTDAGSVSIASDGTDLLVTIAGDHGWLVSELHVYAGTAPVPVNRAGAAAPGQFPYTMELGEPTASITVHIPLEELGAECGDTLDVAVHTVMVLVDEGEVVDTQTGWGFGPNEFRRAWGWWYTHAICCEPPEPTCVRSKGPWREIAGLWPIHELEIAGVTYDAYALVDLLYTGPEDESIDLAHQYIAARLNEAAGAFVDAQTADDLVAAAALLAANADADGLLPFGIFGGDAAFWDFSDLRDALWAYNMGLRDTPLCDPEWIQAAPLPAR